MGIFTILFFLGAIGAAPALLLLALRGKVQESWRLAALLAVGFVAFSLIPILQTGYFGFVPVHSRELWGLQVWYDLVAAVTIALVFILPRAKAAGMRTMPWVFAVAGTGSLALLPMVARLFWLEGRKRDAA